MVSRQSHRWPYNRKRAARNRQGPPHNQIHLINSAIPVGTGEGKTMKHGDNLSTYTHDDFKSECKRVLAEYRKDQPDKKFTLDKNSPYYLRVTNESVQLCIQIKSLDGWIREHTIRL
jgi:hypothetical protein